VCPTAALGWSVERFEAVLAHELGHLDQPPWLRWLRTEGSIFMLPGIVSLVLALIGVVRQQAFWPPFLVAGFVILVASVLVMQAASRTLEFAADQFAAQLVGAGAVADHFELRRQAGRQARRRIRAVVRVAPVVCPPSRPTAPKRNDWNTAAAAVDHESVNAAS
jgi:Zn-dependent membrane protease YugP